MLDKPDWFTLERLRWVLLAVILGAVAHSVIAWLQVVGIIPYTYFSNLMSSQVGKLREATSIPPRSAGS